MQRILDECKYMQPSDEQDIMFLETVAEITKDLELY